MTLEQWKSLQKEYDITISDVDYEKMNIGKGIEFIEKIVEHFDELYKGEDDDVD